MDICYIHKIVNILLKVLVIFLRNIQSFRLLKSFTVLLTI